MRQLSKCLTDLQEWPSCTPELTLAGTVTLNFLSHEEMEEVITSAPNDQEFCYLLCKAL